MQKHKSETMQNFAELTNAATDGFDNMTSSDTQTALVEICARLGVRYIHSAPDTVI